MRRLGPVVLLAAGAALVLGGFLWDVMFAGIPYQDPPPELAADYDRNAGIASALCWVGTGVLASGVLAAAASRAARGRRRQR